MSKNNGVMETYTYKPVMKVLEKYVYNVATLLSTIMKNTLTPEVIAQVLDTPIVLTGGMGNIPGLPERLEQKLRGLLNYEKISVTKQNDGHIAPALGALTLANEINWDRIPPAVRTTDGY
jgi:actin-related protein